MPSTSKWPVFVIAAAVAVPTAAQRFETDATAVVVDVVVRDKGGRLVADLTPADFAVAEDGVAQRITSLQLVGAPPPDGTTPVAQATPPAPAPPQPSRTPGGPMCWPSS